MSGDSAKHRRDDGGGSGVDVSELPKSEDFVLTFEDITVHVPEVAGCLPCCTCKDSPIRNYGVEYFGMSVEERAAFYTLDRVSGCVKSGETCLVLGKSGSGKSTLLRAICSRLNDTDELYGTVSINGIPIGKSNQAWKRMCSYVSADDGTHSPVLTVGETFTFAAQCTSDGQSTNEEIEVRVDSMLEALGLAHVKDTVVGDENIRGVSGGQKRRVTCGEMLLDPNSRIFCLDNITDGLASTDSYSLIQQISATCKKKGIASIVTLLQPSDEIVELFDKLLVLSSDGQPSYFGPVDRDLLRSIFLEEDEGPEKDSGSIADLIMNQPMSTDSVSRPNSMEDKAVSRFFESPLHMDLMKELAILRATAPSIRDRESTLEAILPNKKYSTSRWYQFRIIASRRLKLIMRNSMTYARGVIAIVFGIIVGSLFSALKQDTIGALGRSGYIFLCSFLVLMLSAAVTIPDGFRQRITLFKHRDAEFYSGRVAYIVQVVMDLPLSFVEATLIASISYFWVGMTPGANHFFLFLGTLVGLECVGQAFGRVLVALSRTQVSANVASSLCILLFATVGGFMPAYNQITWALRWLSWLTPVAYAFEAMMLNQFDGTTFFGLVIVDEDGTTNLGSVDGTNYLQSQSLPRAQWGTNTEIKIFDCLFLLIMAMVLDIIGMHFQELTRQWYFNQIRRPQATVMRSSIEKDNNNNNDDSSKNSGALNDDDAEAQVSNEEDSNQPESLAVRNLSYSVNIGKSKKCWKPRRLTIASIFGPLLAKIAGKSLNSKEAINEEEEEEEGVTELSLLNGITARFKRGRMCALMGQSGAGKTTLLDVIAGYKTGGNIEGDILIDGRAKLDSTWKAINGYAEQQDILNPYMSVLETIEFTAACRLPQSVDRSSIINKVISLMGLEEYTNMIVGREKEGEGLPKHARKRLTIANQLVVMPSVLFLDEPTSGLGVNAAALVMGAVRRSTDALGLITLVTIHQPSRKMFESFDDLLMLAKGGKVAYCGELGANSETLLGYFSSLSGEEPPSSVNPADYVLGVLDAGSADDAVAAFKDSSLCKQIDSAIDTDKKCAEEQGPTTTIGRNPGLTFFTEFGLLFRRQFLVQWRNPSYSFMRMSVSAGATFILGLLFFNVQKNIQGAIFSIAAIFFMTFVLVIPMQAAVIPLIEDRAVLYRETVSGTYTRFTYGLGQLFADIPFHALNTLIMYAIIYYLVGFRPGWAYVGYFLFMLFLANWSVMSMGQLYALVTPNEETANGLAGLSVILSVCLMGFLITSSAMPEGWLWANYANLFRYILQGLVTNEVSGQGYNIDVGALIPNITATDSSTSSGNDGRALSNVFAPRDNAKAITFMPGIIPEGTNIAAQGARMLGLALNAGDGENVQESYEDLTDLIECMVENECLVEPVPTKFIECNAVSLKESVVPPCVHQFDAVVSNLVDSDDHVAGCFSDLRLDDLVDSFHVGKTAAGVPASFSLDALSVADHRDVASCLTRKLLPAGKDAGPKVISRGFGDLWNIVMFIRDIIEKGIDIPGDAILFYFGWSEFNSEDFSFSAPWKWHYCVTAVVCFLVAMEAIKLFAVMFIVWTKR